MKEWVKRQLARPEHSIREVMAIISGGKIGVAVIVDGQQKVKGFVTDNDIRRAILRDVDLNTPVAQIMTPNPVVVREDQSLTDRLLFMRDRRVNRAPVVDPQGRIVDIALLWELQDRSNGVRVEETDFLLGPQEDIAAKKTILVLGGAGYIGSVLCRELLRSGYRVRVLDALLFGQQPVQELLAHPQFELIRGDVRDLTAVVHACFGVYAVVNLAAIVGDSACELDANHSILVNYISAKAIADVCKHLRVHRYLFVSTCSVYGASRDARRLREDSIVRPISLYAETKLKTESGVLSLADKGFSPCILRLATVYGLSPRMRFDLVVNTLAIHAFTKREIRVFGGSQWRPNVHVQDVARAIGLCLEADTKKVHKEIFNVGSNDQNYQIDTIADMVADAVGGVTVHRDTNSVDERNYNVSFDKIRDVLGFNAIRTVPFAVEEIRKEITGGRFSDFSDKQYSNVKQQEYHVFG